MAKSYKRPPVPSRSWAKGRKAPRKAPTMPSLKRYSQFLAAYELLKRVKGIKHAEVFAYLRHYLMNQKFENLMNPRNFGAEFAAHTWERFKKEAGTKDSPPRWEVDTGKLLNPARETTEDSSPLMKPELVEVSTSQPVQRTSPGSTDGIKYYQKFEIQHGKPNKMLQHAIDEYGVKKKTLWATGGNKLVDLMYCQAGINRKGLWAPILNSWDAAQAELENWEAYESHNCISKGLIYAFCERWALTDAMVAYIEFSRNSGNQDVLFPIVSTSSVHTIRSAMSDTPLDVSIYLIRRKSGISAQIPAAATFSNWQVGTASTITTSPAHAPTTGMWQQGGTQQLNTQAYNYAFPRESVSLTCNDVEGAQQNIRFSAENPMVLGFFPTWSPEFRRQYDVIEKRTQRLKPMDTLEVHFEEHFSKCFSYRNFLGTFTGDYSDKPKATYCRGDYEMIIEFHGIPGTCKVPIPGDGATSNVRMNADALRSRIRKTVKHTINYAWRSMAYEDPTATAIPPDELVREGWITSAIRDTTVSRRTNYFSEGGSAIIMTNMSEQEGDGI